MSLEDLKEQEIKQKWIQLTEKTIPFPWDEMYDSFRAGFLAAETPSHITGNQTLAYLKEHNETLKKVHADEPIFVLRAQDNTAPAIIFKWISKNLDTVSEAKLKEAYHTAMAMRRYSDRRNPT